jgi:CBS domain containing-hemolysin-like protein
VLILYGFVAITLLTVATGYFVAQEFTYLAVDRGRLRAMADGGDQAAERAYQITQRLSFMLSGAQFGITVTALLAGYVAEPLLGSGLASLFGVAGVPAAVSTSVSVALALVVATVVQMVLGELFPKNLAIAKPEALARSLSRSTLMYLKVAGPVIRFFDATANRLLRMVGIEPVEELPQGATADDLQRIIDDSQAGGHLDPELSLLLDRGLDFRSLTAAQAMTPRVALETLRCDDPVVTIVQRLDTGRSRFPVLGENVDDLLGVVGLAELLTVPPEDRATTTIRDIVSPPVLVPESLPLPAVLERLRTEHRQLACVLDEFGGFAGVITLEDLAEELVGEIQDEDDLAEATPEQGDDGSWVVPARLRIDELADSTGIQFADDDAYETVSGLVLHRLGRIPKIGDIVQVAAIGHDVDDVPDVRIEVLDVARHVPRTVRMTVTTTRDSMEVNGR